MEGKIISEIKAITKYRNEKKGWIYTLRSFAFLSSQVSFQAPVRKHFLPTVATCVDFSHNGSTTKVTSRAASKMNDLLSVQRLHRYS